MGCASDKTLAVADRSVAGSGAILIGEAFSQLSSAKAVGYQSSDEERRSVRIEAFTSKPEKASIQTPQENTG
jgi:hypothetical protein